MKLNEQLNKMKSMMGIKEDGITLEKNPNVMYFFHGGNLDDVRDDIQQKIQRQEYGPGLYLITDYSQALKYSKGNRKLYLVTVEKGTDINDAEFDYQELSNDFLSKLRGYKKSFGLEKFIKNGSIKAYIINNHLINNRLLTPYNSALWKNFLLSKGIDYEIIDNAFGAHETMMVLYNTKKIKSVKRVMPNDKLPTFDLRDYNTLAEETTEPNKVSINLESYEDVAELVPISELIKIREFDRRTQPKWDKEDSDENIETLKNLFLTNGITRPLIIDYSQSEKRILLVEGNHRLNAAIELGLKYMPCRVVRTTRPFPKHILSKTMPVSGVEPDTYGYVKGDLKPSEVGIPGTKPLTENPY